MRHAAGELAQRLAHPSHGVSKTYLAQVKGTIPRDLGRRLRDGVELEDGLVRPEYLEALPLGDRTWAFSITLTEGRNREVRRMCEALGLEVLRLVRTSFGPVELGSLASGEVRQLSAKERKLVEAMGRSAD